MDQVTSIHSLPFELREMIWERYKVSSEPMIHIFTYTRSAKEPQLINSHRAISLPMPDMADMKTTRSLLQVSREVRHAILNRREVFCFSRPLKDIACVYVWKPRSIHDPGPTCCLTSYSSLFVDWEKDVFYFPYDYQGYNRILQDPGLEAKVQHVAFASRIHPRWLSKSSWHLPWHLLPILQPGISEFRRLYLMNTDLLLRSTRSLKALQSIRLVVGLVLTQESSRYFYKASEWWRRMTAIKCDPYGFCDPRDAGAVFPDADGHRVFADYCRRMDIEVSRKMSATASQSFTSARDTAEQDMTREANAEQRSTGGVKLSMVVDHLGGWDDEFQGYNRVTNSAAPLPIE